MERFIVKVQTPIVGNEVLIYDKTRRVQIMTPITPAFRQLSKGRHKWFMFAEVNAEGKLELLANEKEPEEQEW